MRPLLLAAFLGAPLLAVAQAPIDPALEALMRETDALALEQRQHEQQQARERFAMEKEQWRHQQTLERLQRVLAIHDLQTTLKEKTGGANWYVASVLCEPWHTTSCKAVLEDPHGVRTVVSPGQKVEGGQVATVDAQGVVFQTDVGRHRLKSVVTLESGKRTGYTLGQPPVTPVP
jgi:hypothetical protein